MHTHTNTQSPAAPDRAALLACLTVTDRAETDKGIAGRSPSPTYDGRPFYVYPKGAGIMTCHASPALAIARLASL